MTAEPRDRPAPRARPLCTEEIVSCYEALVELARGQVESLRRGDVAGFGRLVEEKGRVIRRIRRAQETASEPGSPSQRLSERVVSRLVERAERALEIVLEKEAEALALVTGLRDAIGSELSHVTRGDAGLRSYRGAVAARLVDERR